MVSIISEIAIASREQTAGLSNVNQAVSQMESMTAENAQLAQRTVTAAREVQSRAEDLDQAVTRFRLPAHANAAAVAPKQPAPAALRLRAEAAAG